MSSDASINNVLSALYQSSNTIKMYVDAVVAGHKVPYTILMKSTDMERNEQIVSELTKIYVDLKTREDTPNTHYYEMQMMLKKILEPLNI